MLGILCNNLSKTKIVNIKSVRYRHFNNNFLNIVKYKSNLSTLETPKIPAKDIIYNALENNGVNIKGTILKPSMVTPGSLSDKVAIREVAEMTVRCLKENIPSDLPGVAFLSGGQTELEATAHLNEMNKIGEFPWKLSFSYGRALQQSALKAWSGQSENIFIAQDELSHRAEMNKLAALGQWDIKLEDR